MTNISISWEAVIAICTAMSTLAGAFAWFVRSIIREELGGVKKEQAVIDVRLELLESTAGLPAHHRRRNA